MEDTVLIVRHGPNRGRISDYCQSLFDDLSAQRPEIGARLSIYETGSKQPDLSSVRAVVFLLGDPLEELYPDCFRDAMSIYERSLACGIRTVNPPPLLARYRKRDQVREWSALGLPTPPGLGYDTLDDLLTILEDRPLPVLLRADSDHCMEEIAVVRNPRQVARLRREDVPLPGILTPLVDVRRGYAETGKDRIWSKLHHKKRVYVLGQEVIPDSLYFSMDPTVSLETSMFRRLRQRRQLVERRGVPLPLRRGWMRLAEWRCWAPDIFRLEQEFLEREVADASVFRAAASALGLEWVAFDYATLADGSPILWEANPYPLIPPLASGLHSRRRRLADRAVMQLQAFGHFFENLLDAAESASRESRRRNQLQPHADPIG